MTMNRNGDKFPTTIGELIVELSDAAFEVCEEKRDAYFLVALALTHLLGRAHRDKTPIADPVNSQNRNGKGEHLCFESTKCTRISLPSS
jgi:hypothetical protein